MLRKPAVSAWIALLCLVLMTAPSTAVDAAALSPAEVDGGRWVDIYRDYLQAHGAQNILLADLDIDGVPELIVLDEWGRWYDSGWVVKATEDGMIEYHSLELLPSNCSLAFCRDPEGNYAWYINSFSAGTGLQNTAVMRLYVTPEMAIVREEWLSYSTEQVENEETGELELVNTGYRVEGESVDYDTYRQEEIQRLKLTVLFSHEGWYRFPEDWDEAIRQPCVAAKDPE